MSLIEEKNLKVIAFSGKQEEWKFWEVKFLARARRKGFREILLGTVTVPKDSEKFDLTKPAEKEQSEIRDKNELAFEELVLSIDTSTGDGQVAFQSICCCRNDDYKNGYAPDAWKRLQDKYAPNLAPMKLELKSEFQRSKLRDVSEDPDVWISKLESIRARLSDMKAPISDDDFIIHVLNNLPKDYEVQVSKLEDRFSSTTNPLTIGDMRNELNLKYARLKRQSEDKTEVDQALAAFRQFKGKCTNCGKFGHKSSECRSKNGGRNESNADKSKKSKNAKNKEKGSGSDKKDKSHIQCFNCGEMGHYQSKCPHDKSKVTSTEKNTDTVLMTVGRSNTIKNDTWIADSAASTHIVNSDVGLYDYTAIREPVKIGNGKLVYATKVGKLRVTYEKEGGEQVEFIMENVQYIPNFWVNLFSLTAAMSKNCTISNEGRAIVVEKNSLKLKFNDEITTQNGFVCGIVLRIKPEEDLSFAAVGNRVRQDINELHRKLGHASESIVRETAKFYNWTTTNKFENCTSCALAKSKQKNTNKEKKPRSETPGERLFLDISSVQEKSFGGSKYWLLAVDDATDFCFSKFLKTKDQTSTVMISLIRDLKNNEETIVKKIRCDNAGENVAFQRNAKEEGLGLNFEYTARATPQQNGRVERKFATLFGRVRSMLNSAGLVGTHEDLRKGLWAECAATATTMENIAARNDKEPPFRQLYKKDSPLIQSLRTFGEIGVVHDAKKIRGKLDNRGKISMFVGYAADHAGDTFKMLNLDTKRIWQSRDIRWLAPSLPAYAVLQLAQLKTDKSDDDDDADLQVKGNPPPPPPAHQPATQADADNNADVADANNNAEDSDDEARPPAPTRARVHPNAKAIRALKKLSTSYNPLATDYLRQDLLAADDDTVATSNRLGRDEDYTAPRVSQATTSVIYDLQEDCQSDHTNVASAAIDYLPNFAFYTRNKVVEPEPPQVTPIDFEEAFEQRLIEPSTFEEAFHHPDPEQRTKWREAIHKEFKDMNNRGVWRKVKRSTIPQGRRCIKSKWVFKIKRDGIFRARLVACGYSQIPGVDFTENFAPVMHDVTWRILLVAMLVWQMDAIIIDVETAFLHGDLDEEIYMNLPDGMEGSDDECLLLLKALYGLVQGARQWWKKFVGILKTIDFKGGYADPCLMIKRSDDGTIFASIYVDDNFCVGHTKALTMFVEDLKKQGLTVKVSSNLTDYLSCSIKISEDRKSAWIGQPHLIEKLRAKFGHLVQNMQSYRTPGTPGQRIVRVQEEWNKISKEDQKLYRSAVGTLLYLLKYSRPCLANPLRELSKALDGANQATFKELKRVIKFVLDTADYGLKIQPIQKPIGAAWTMTVFSDSDYAGDSETRISVTGFCVFLMGVPISWKSRAQRNVTLSSSEAEFVALSEAAKEIKFIVQVLLSIGIEVELPIIVRVDNVGAIFMAENVSTSTRTKHVDVRYHFVREFVEEGFIRIIFVRTKDNRADIFTKNVVGDLFDKHNEDLTWKARDMKKKSEK